MNEERVPTKGNSKRSILYVLLAIVLLFAASLIIQQCDSEKVKVCDVTTGHCDYESTCRPLLVDILS